MVPSRPISAILKEVVAWLVFSSLSVSCTKSEISVIDSSPSHGLLTRSIVILEKGIIPANANFEEVNPKLDTDFYHTKVGAHVI